MVPSQSLVIALLFVVAFPDRCMAGYLDFRYYGATTEDYDEQGTTTEIPTEQGTTTEIPTEPEIIEDLPAIPENLTIREISPQTGRLPYHQYHHMTNIMNTANNASETPFTLPKSPVSTISDFSIEFHLFENRMKSFIDNVRREQLSTFSDMSRFRTEIDEYVVRLPTKKVVTIKTRNFCYCRGEMMAPCPSQCMYSCYYSDYDGSGWNYGEDCRFVYSQKPCKCTMDGLSDCQNNLDICLNQTTKYENTDKLCSQFSIDKNCLLRSFELILNLLMEPLRIQFRGIESRLTFLRQASVSVSSLSKITAEMCKNPNDPICSSDAQTLLSTEKDNYRQTKKNITLELIKTQNQIEAVSKNVEKLKEEAFAKVNRSIKEYSCCLKSLNLAVDEYDCSGIDKKPSGSSMTYGIENC